MTQLELFKNVYTIPETEGIKYAGSKLKILPYIIQMLSELNDIKNVLDGFSGTTRVSQAFAQLGFNTTANDISVWSETFGRCYLLANRDVSYYQEIIDFLNSLSGYDGCASKRLRASLRNEQCFCQGQWVIPTKIVGDRYERR